MTFADSFYGAYDNRKRQMQAERDQDDQRRRNAFADELAMEDRRWQAEARGRERSAWRLEDAKRAAITAAGGDPSKLASAFGQFGDVQGMAQIEALRGQQDQRARVSKADAAEQLKRAARMALATPDPQARERIIQNATQYATAAGYSPDVISAEVGQLRAYLASEGEQPEYRLMEDGTQLRMGPNGWERAGQVDLPQQYDWQGAAGGTPYRVDARTGQVIEGQGTIPMSPLERAALARRSGGGGGGAGGAYGAQARMGDMRIPDYEPYGRTAEGLTVMLPTKGAKVKAAPVAMAELQQAQAGLQQMYVGLSRADRLLNDPEVSGVLGGSAGKTWTELMRQLPQNGPLRAKMSELEQLMMDGVLVKVKSLTPVSNVEFDRINSVFGVNGRAPASSLIAGVRSTMASTKTEMGRLAARIGYGQKFGHPDAIAVTPTGEMFTASDPRELQRVQAVLDRRLMGGQQSQPPVRSNASNTVTINGVQVEISD